MNSLEGKIAIVTGGGGGIGSATARLLAMRGASVTVADLHEARARQVATEICEAGGKAIHCTVDVGSEQDIQRMVGLTVDEFGGLDVLHNNAALVNHEANARDIDIATMTVDDWDMVMAINLRGPMLGCKHAIPEMLKRGGGSIINTSAAAGILALGIVPAYGISKAGVNSLTQYVATEYGKQGIRCNAVSPGQVLSPNVVEGHQEEFLQISLDSTLTPYLGTPGDIANMVAFLASDDSRFVTGQIISVDGGLTAHMPTYADLQRRMPGAFQIKKH